MKNVYLVKGYVECDDDFYSSTYGVFSTEEKANKIAEDLRKNIRENNETEEIEIVKLDIDEPTEDYYFMMNN